MPLTPAKHPLLRLFCWLVLQKACCVYGQIDVPGYDIRRFSVQNGLNNQIINSVVKERNNNLWIGTYNGLYRYDGFRTIRFDQQYHLPPINQSNYISDLAIEPDSGEVVFVCTKQHALLIDLERDKYVPAGSIGIPDDIFQRFTRFEWSDKGYFFGLQQGRIYKIRRLGFRNYSCEPWFDIPASTGLLTDMVADPYNPEAVWLLNDDGRVWYANPQGTRQYRLPDTSKAPHLSAGLINLVFTPEGIFGWDVKKNIYRFDPLKMQFTHAANNTSLYDLVPNLRAVDIAMRQKATLRCHISLDIGQVVLGTSLGLFIVRKKINGFHNMETFLEEEIRAIYVDSTGRWAVGTYNGLYSGRPNDKKVRKSRDLNTVWRILPVSPTVWLLGLETLKGLKLWNPVSGMVIDSTLADPLPNGKEKRSVLSLEQDKYGIKWVGTYTTLYCSDPSAPFRFYIYRDPISGDTFSHGFIRDICATRDSSIWVGADDGLFRLAYNPAFRAFQVITTVSLVGKVQVSDIYEDCWGDIWVATKGKGLARINKASGRIIWYDIESGLCDNMLCRIESSRHDSLLWISTHNGLSRMDVHSGVFHNFYEESGFPGNEFNSGSSFHDPRGSIFFGGVNGLVYFNPDSIFIPEYRYETSVPYVQIYSHRIDTLIPLARNPGGLKVDAYPELLEFVLVCNERIKPDKVRYRYRLLGLSDKWHFTIGENKVKYVHLPPGNYVFQVQAMPLEGHTGAIYELPVFVETPFNETVWFWILILTILKVVVYGVYRYQLRQIRNKQLVRQQIADDLHDDIGNKLNIIGILAQKAAINLNKSKKTPPADSVLSRLYDLSRDTQISLLTMIWAVDPTKDRLVNLITRMQDFADDFLRPLVPQFSFIAPEVLPDRNISLRVRHHLMLIYQELLVNMIKHTHSSCIQVQLSLHGSVITLVITNHHAVQTDERYSTVSGNRGKSTLNRRLLAINGSIDYSENSAGLQKIVVTVDQIFKNA